MSKHRVKCLESVVELLTEIQADLETPDLVIPHAISEKLDKACDLYAEEYSRHEENYETIFDLSENFGSYFNEYYTEDSVSGLINIIREVISNLERRVENLSYCESTDEDTEDGDIYEDSEDTEEVADRTPVSEKYEFFSDAKAANEKRWQRSLKVSKKFHDASRFLDENTANFQQRLFSAFKRKTAEVIDAKGFSARSLIAAYGAAVEQSLAKIKQSELTTQDKIAEKLGWHRKKGMDWARLKFSRGYVTASKNKSEKVMINAQIRPAPGNLSDIFVNGVGSYGEGDEGKTPDILTLIHKLTYKNPQTEQNLAKLMIYYAKNGAPLGKEKLWAEGCYLYTNNQECIRELLQINRACFLYTIFEVTRRMNQGFRENSTGKMQKVPEFPFALAIAKALWLVAEGHLRMAHVFDSNAPYGVFTGEKIMHDNNLVATRKKFENVFDLFDQHYLDANIDELKQKSPSGKAIPYREVDHQILLEVEGGSDLTEGEEYSTSDEETTKLQM